MLLGVSRSQSSRVGSLGVSALLLVLGAAPRRPHPALPSRPFPRAGVAALRTLIRDVAEETRFVPFTPLLRAECRAPGRGTFRPSRLGGVPRPGRVPIPAGSLGPLFLRLVLSFQWRLTPLSRLTFLCRPLLVLFRFEDPGSFPLEALSPSSLLEREQTSVFFKFQPVLLHISKVCIVSFFRINYSKHCF